MRPGGEQLTGQRGASLAEDVQETEPGERLEGARQAALPHFEQLGAARLQQPPRGVGRRLRHHDGPRLTRGRQHLGVRRQRTVVRDDDANGVPPGGQAHGQLGVVPAHRTRADHDGVDAGAQFVHGPAAVETADPAGVAPRGGDLAVERHGRLVGHQRPARAVVSEEGRVLLPGALPPAVFSEVDHHAAVAQLAQAAAVHLRVRVAKSDHCAGYAPRHECVGAGRGLALVAAGLERAVERCAPGALAGLGERHRLSVRRSGRQVPAAPDDLSVAHEDRADQGIRVRAAAASLGQGERLVHVHLVVHTKRPEACASGRTTPRRRACFSSGL